jgi:predicted RNase H-like nuclease (RuvC/YqgF family)
LTIKAANLETENLKLNSSLEFLNSEHLRLTDCLHDEYSRREIISKELEGAYKTNESYRERLANQEFKIQMLGEQLKAATQINEIFHCKRNEDEGNFKLFESIKSSFVTLMQAKMKLQSIIDKEQGVIQELFDHFIKLQKLIDSEEDGTEEIEITKQVSIY